MDQRADDVQEAPTATDANAKTNRPKIVPIVYDLASLKASAPAPAREAAAEADVPSSAVEVKRSQITKSRVK